MPAQSGYGGDIHIHGSMVDPRGFEKLLEGSKHKLRSVINSSYSENSGAADA
jgi:cold shock CspA family protein